MATRRASAGEPLGRRLVRGALGGFVAGLVFIGITMWFSDSLGNPTEGPLNLISTLVLGGDALETGDVNAGVGFVVHSVLSVAFGMLFALVVSFFGNNGTLALAGGVYGALLYVVNFQLIARAGIERFLQGPNQPFELVIHVVFGYLLAVAFYSAGPRREERVIDLRTPTSGRQMVSA
jgi:hypothetical protein